MSALAQTVDQYIAHTPQLREQGLALARTLHEAVLQGGEPSRQAADMLHGTWLGHPLHPVLTDIVVGAWGLGGMADLLSMVSASDNLHKVADLLTTAGAVAAVPTAISGLTDFTTIPKASASTGLVHALANEGAFVLYLLSIAARRRGDRGSGILLSTLGLGLLFAGAYLGGHLVYHHRVGVKRTKEVHDPETWTPVIPVNELAERTPCRVQVAGHPVLLFRLNGHFYAVGAKCPHAGAPLEEGRFDGFCVECPWHQSVFDLRDGGLVHGPSTYALPNYAVRIRDEQIELRVA